jgi:phenylacetate-coenzyme A ligase PaaK-like adenylate-forming protein
MLAPRKLPKRHLQGIFMANQTTVAVDRKYWDEKLETQSRADWDAKLAPRFAGHLKSITGVSARIVILPPDTLPRATHKAKRVEDRRQSVWY